MLRDIPYEKIKDYGSKYDIWVLRDVYNHSFADIVRQYERSYSCVLSNYNDVLELKITYYVLHLSLVYGYENTEHFAKIRKSAEDCYKSAKYVAAYFEKEYAAVLREYRNGEPGVPAQVLRNLPPLRNAFSKRTVSSIIRLRETNGMTYAAIGKRLRMTQEKAEALYNHHYHCLYCELSKKLIQITGDSDLRCKYRTAFRIGSGKKKYDQLVADYPALCKSLIKATKEK